MVVALWRRGFECVLRNELFQTHMRNGFFSLLNRSGAVEKKNLHREDCAVMFLAILGLNNCFQISPISSDNL